MKIEILMSSLKKKHEASLIAFISIGMMATGFALTAVAPPLLYIFESGDFSVRLSFLKASLDRHINIAIMGIFLLVAGLTVFIQIVDDGFIKGLSKLTDLIPDEVASQRLMIVLALASFTTSRVSPSTASTIITGGLLIMISSIGLSILLAEFYKVFDSPTLWIASLVALTVVLIPLSFLMLYLELPEIIVKNC